jgi:hypothetical protein
MFRFRSLVPVFLCTLSTILVSAQTPDTAVLKGNIEDSTHAAVVGAAVTVRNHLTGLERNAQSDGHGYFTVSGLPTAGSYDVVATKSGFADGRVEHLSLGAGSTAEVTLTLSVAGGTSTVVVRGSADEVRVDEPQLGIHLTSSQIEEVPLPNRRVTFLPLLSAANRPAINQGDVFMNQNLFTTNGAGRRQTWFEVDGATGNDSWGRQTMFTNLPLMAVEEMTVLTNSFSAEYGASTGSVVNIVTQSGGDKLHGQALGMWRPEGTSASLSGFTPQNAASGNDVTSDTLGQGAGSLSGPLWDKKTHYFAAGEYSHQDRVSPVTSPLAPGNFVGKYRGGLGSVRLDRQLTDKNNVFLRAGFDIFSDTNPNGIVGGASLPTVARTFHRRTYSLEAGDTAVLSSSLVNNLRLQFQLASPITEFDPVVNGTQFVVATSQGTFTSGTSQSALLMNRQYQINDSLAFNKGRHQIVAGGNAIYAHTGGNSKEFGGPIYLGKFTYKNCTLAVSVCESPTYLNDINNVQNYQQSYGNANYTVNDTLWSLFVQDNYHASERLTLNFGLRYEQQTFTDSRLDFAPRVGFAYDTMGNGKLVLRGGFGIYHSQIVDNSEANYALTGPTGVFNYTATPGQVGFPTTVASAPLPAFPPSAVAPLRSLYIRPGQSAYLNQFFPTSTLVGYPDKLLNPYSEQWTLSLQQQLAPNWILSLDYVGTHTLRINRPLDVDGPTPFIRTAANFNAVRTAQAANCTRPYWIAWYKQNGTTCNTSAPTNPQPPYSTIQSDVNDGYLHYDALDVNVSHTFSKGFSMLASYTWSHTIDNVDPDATSQNPNDTNFTGQAEYGNALYDQRHRLVVSGVYTAPLKIKVGGVGSFSSGLPYNYVTGASNSGNTGATTDRPVINGVLVGRNTGRGNGIYSVDPFVGRLFPIYHERVTLDLRAEAFNVLNHANFVSYNGTYGNNAAPMAGFGSPLNGVTAQLPARSMQFSAKVSF